MREPLEHFLSAQLAIYPKVLQELKQGQKHTHWMWFVFPQLAGLGLSVVSRKFAIADISHARAYLGHPVLADRLYECTDLVLAHKSKPLSQIFAYPDDLKFHACMTLFYLADGDENPEFRLALQQCFDGKTHQQTLDLLKLKS